VKFPAAEGENVTPILHVLPAARVVPHVVVSPNALAFVPEIAIAIPFRALLPVLLTVMT